MKNRLQFRYHIPETLPTRAQAMAYLEEAFAIGRTNTENTTLPAEPLVMLYNDTLVDSTNGMTEAKRLETSNVILAIGRGGDGVDVFNNQKYFVIDFAKHDEEIVGLTEDVASINEIITAVQDNIDEIKSSILEHTNAIEAINAKIGEKGDSCEKNTIYGYIQCVKEIANEALDTVEDEIIRSTQEDEHLNSLIVAEKEERIAAVEAERDARIDADNILRDTLAEANANIQRIDGELANEVARAIAKEGELEALIIDTGVRLNDEIIRAQTRENELHSADTVLQQNINANTEAINLETVNRTNADAILETKINANGKQIKENKVISNGKTILVSGPSENGTNIEVNVDNKTIVINETGTLSVASDALVQYTGENAINVSEVAGATKVISLKVNSNDKILTNDVNGLITTLSLKWVKATVDGEKDEIQLIGKDDIIISRIDVADFIKDGMLDSVKLDTTNPETPVLVFTFNSAAGKETITINATDLVEIYYAGNGLTKEENTFSIVVDPASDDFLTVSSNGIKVSGIKDAINLVVQNYKDADNVLRDEFTAANALLAKDYAAADSAVEAKLLAAIIEKADNTTVEAINARLINAEGEISTLQATDEQIRKDYVAADTALKTELAAELVVEKTRAEKTEQELANKITLNENAIAILNGDSTVNGSVKDTVFDAALGAVITTVSTEDATEQSLIKKFIVDGAPFIYASNNSSDMKHNGNALNVVLDDLRNDVDTAIEIANGVQGEINELTGKVSENTANIAVLTTDVAVNKQGIETLNTEVSNLKGEDAKINALISTLQSVLAALQTELATVKTELATANGNLAAVSAELAAFKKIAITNVQGTVNEIKVTQNGNTATVGFADDAYFVAGA